MEKREMVIQKRSNAVNPLSGISQSALAAAALLTAVFLWGGSFVAMRIAVTELHPMAVMWCRMIFAFLVILPMIGKLIPKNYQSGDWKLLLPMVLFQPCLYFFLESNALKLTTASQAGVISAFVPILVGIGAALFLYETITIQTIIGATVSLTGVFFLTLYSSSEGGGTSPLAGNILEFLAMVCAAGNMLIVRRLSDRYNPWSLTAMQIVAGLIFFSPGLFYLAALPAGVWNHHLLLSLLFLGVFVTFGAFGLYNWGISRVRASKASAFINLVPVVAVILGWMVLGEVLSFPQILAAAAVVSGVMFSQRF